MNRRSADDAGSVLVEFALVLPMLIMLMLGVIEFGTIHRNRTLIAGAARAAGRVESQAGNSNNPNTSADLYALSSFASAAGRVKSATLLKIVIYKSTSAVGTVPPLCLTVAVASTGPNGVAGVCNVYTPVEFKAVVDGTATANFGCATSTSWDHQWCVATRDSTLANADWVGVWAQYQYQDMTSLMPFGKTKLTDYAVFRMEPSV